MKLHLPLLVALALHHFTAESNANPLLRSSSGPGFVVLAEQRFDPAVQRYMAQRSLNALPLQNGQLYYIYPQNTSTQYLEEMQIRFMQALISERRTEQTKPSTTKSQATPSPPIQTEQSQRTD